MFYALIPSWREMLIRQGMQIKFRIRIIRHFFLDRSSLIIKNLFEMRFSRNWRRFKLNFRKRKVNVNHVYIYSDTIGGWKLRVGSMLKFNGDDKFKKKFHDNWMYIIKFRWIQSSCTSSNGIRRPRRVLEERSKVITTTNVVSNRGKRNQPMLCLDNATGKYTESRKIRRISFHPPIHLPIPIERPRRIDDLSYF